MPTVSIEKLEFVEHIVVKILFCCILISMAYAKTSLAQATAPTPVDLSYHFKAGTVLHYQRLDEMRSPDNPPGYEGGNFDSKEDIQIAVVNVDLDGSATLVVQNTETHDFKGGDDTHDVLEGPRVSHNLGEDIPLYSVKVDKYGMYLDGMILRRNTHDSIFHEKMKDPNFNGWGVEDSTAIKRSLYKNFAPRSARSNVRRGSEWNDSSHEVTNPPHIPLNHSASGPVVLNPPGPSYNSYRNDYSLSQNLSERKAGIYELTTKAINYQVFGGTVAGHGKTDRLEQFRTSDGLPVLRTETSGGLTKEYMKRTFTLISVDSTAK